MSWGLQRRALAVLARAAQPAVPRAGGLARGATRLDHAALAMAVLRDTGVRGGAACQGLEGGRALWGARGFAASAAGGGAGGAARRQAMLDAQQQKSTNQAMYLVALIVGMVGATYASVPLYRMFCQATGFGGTVKEGKSVEDRIAELQENPDEERDARMAKRPVTIYFNADVADGMPWRFKPCQRAVVITPGESTLAFYNATNSSKEAITGVSTYNVTPQKAGLYFSKIQCFCFEEQRLQPKESIDMPVFFYLDPDFADDPKMADCDNITLSYTFFRVEDAPEDALAFQNHAAAAGAAAK